MQGQLNQMEKDFGIEWREYRLDELFDNIVQGRRLKKQDQVLGGLPFVMAGVTNTGIVNYVGNIVRIFPENSLTVDIFGNVFYRGYEYGMGDDVGAYWNAGHHIPKCVMLYIAAAMQKSMSGKFDFGHKLRSSQSLDFKIHLPTITRNGKSEIAFDFIEQFITALQTERIATLQTERNATLQAYLTASGLKDYTLADDEQAALDGLGAVAWGAFKIGDLFEKANLKNHNESFNKLLDTSTVRTAEFNLPLVNAKLGNNGIMFYGREKDFDSAEMTIDVISNGAVATGTVYAQPFKAGVLWDAYLLKPNAQDMNKQKLLYLSTALQKSIKTKFGWEDKAVWSKVHHEVISLPINSDGTPNYDYMTLVMSAMQKVVIKNVVDYLDLRIGKTIELTHSAP
ncbi:MAG: restriction endonuclease subunit S [Sideroxyarcus sp.]|nr:restriction endonuclease subunit S [Sideroxyarcus sp.]